MTPSNVAHPLNPIATRFIHNDVKVTGYPKDLSARETEHVGMKRARSSEDLDGGGEE